MWKLLKCEKIFRFLTRAFLINRLCRVYSSIGPYFYHSSNWWKYCQSAFSSAVNYGVKKQTGKSPMEHALAYADEINPEKKEPCLSFVTN